MQTRLQSVTAAEAAMRTLYGEACDVYGYDPKEPHHTFLAGPWSTHTTHTRTPHTRTHKARMFDWWRS